MHGYPINASVKYSVSCQTSCIYNTGLILTHECENTVDDPKK